jgi:hypothetical protein
VEVTGVAEALGVEETDGVAAEGGVAAPCPVHPLRPMTAVATTAPATRT